MNKGLFNRNPLSVKAVDDVSFDLNSGETLGIVGESGCGKSTLGRTMLQLHQPTGGEVFIDGENFFDLTGDKLFQKRKEFQIIFQDPYASLNPRMTVYEIIKEPMDIHNVHKPEDRLDKVIEIMKTVGLRQDVINRYPHEFSGGQRQRIGIARTLALNPKIIIADEPVSALDVSVQSQVLNLIKKLQKEFGISFIFISHDLAVIQHICHNVGVMYLGKIVEKADTETLFKSPKHPYTKALLSAIPIPDPNRKSKRLILEGDVPSPINPPSGCPFHPRCPEATEQCKTAVPQLRKISQKGAPDQEVACHLV